MGSSFARRNLIFILVGELSLQINISLGGYFFTNILRACFITFEVVGFLVNMKILGSDLKQMIISSIVILYFSNPCFIIFSIDKQ
jgi:hypothetical protein